MEKNMEKSNQENMEKSNQENMEKSNPENMEKIKCGFGQDMINNRRATFTICTGKCPDNCEYFIEPKSTIKITKAKRHD